MPKKRRSAVGIVELLRQVEVAMGQGKSTQIARGGRVSCEPNDLLAKSTRKKQECFAEDRHPGPALRPASAQRVVNGLLL
jgi:hypothetical protein